MAKYTTDDLTIRSGEQSARGGITTHIHTIVFARPLTDEEKRLFTRMIQGFYYTVHFSRQFGDGLVAEPVIEKVNKVYDKIYGGFETFKNWMLWIPKPTPKPGE